MFATGILKNNSIFKQALEDFILETKSYGFTKHWKKRAGQKLFESARPGKSISVSHQAFTPLRLEDFKWLGKLLAFFYGASCIIFICEIFICEILFARWQKKSVKKVINMEV